MLWLERIREAALRAWQGDEAAERILIVEAHPAIGSSLAELSAAVGGDGGRVVTARVKGLAVPGEEEPLAARALLRLLSPSLARSLPPGSGPAAFARAAMSVIERAEGPLVLVLEEAQRADHATVRAWWALARRLAVPGPSSRAVSVAVLSHPPRENDPWDLADRALGAQIRLRRVRVEPAEAPRRRPGPEQRPSGAFRAVRRVDRSNRAAGWAMRAAAAAIDGRTSEAERLALRAEEAAESADDLVADAAAAVARAVAALGCGAPDSRERLDDAVVAAELAGDPRWIAATQLTTCIAATAAGDLHRGQVAADRAKSGAHLLPRALAALRLGLSAECALRARDGVKAESARRELSDLARAGSIAAGAIEEWIGGLGDRFAQIGSPVARLSSAARRLERYGWHLLAGRAWMDAAAAAETAADMPRALELLSLARAAWSRSGNVESAATVDRLLSEGLSARGARGQPETLEALLPMLDAQSPEEAASRALEVALALVPARGGSVALGSPEFHRVVALRGRALFAAVPGPGDLRLPVVLRSRSGLEIGRLVLDRRESDPRFSREERRLVEVVAELAAASADARDRRSLVRSTPWTSVEGPLPKAGAAARATLDDRLKATEHASLLESLARHGGNLSRTARALGLSRNGLKMKLARHGMR